LPTTNAIWPNKGSEDADFLVFFLKNKEIASSIFSQTPMRSSKKALTCPSFVDTPKQVQTQNFPIF